MVFFWNATEIQIRFKGMIKKNYGKESDMHFASRKKRKKHTCDNFKSIK